jgi:hypothetical protein
MLPPLEPWLLKNAKELAVDRDLFDDERIIRLPKATLQVTSVRCRLASSGGSSP